MSFLFVFDFYFVFVFVVFATQNTIFTIKLQKDTDKHLPQKYLTVNQSNSPTIYRQL